MANITPQIESNSTNPGLAYQSQGCEYIYLYDTTGAYSGTNTGGYGAPNFDYTDISESFIDITRPGETTPDRVTLDGSSTPTAQAFANPSLGTQLAIDTIETGQSASSEEHNDGVYQIDYYVVITGTAVTASWTNGTTTVTATIGDFADYEFATHILAPDGELYAIASTSGGPPPTTITLQSAYAGGTISSASQSPVFYVSYKCTAICQIGNCMLEKLGDEFEMANDPDQCDECQEHYAKSAKNAFEDFFGIQAMAINENWDRIDEYISIYKEKYCEDSDCGCS